MLRLFVAVGSLIFEVATMATEGAMGVTVVVTGMAITAIHLISDSCSFHSLVNRMTGFDLPECLPPLPSDAPGDRSAR